jgi:hypothetical protein
MKFTDAQFCQNLLFRLSQSNTPVSSSQQQITDRHAETQDHSSYRHNKKGFSKIDVIESQSS